MSERNVRKILNCQFIYYLVTLSFIDIYTLMSMIKVQNLPPSGKWDEHTPDTEPASEFLILE